MEEDFASFYTWMTLEGCHSRGFFHVSLFSKPKNRKRSAHTQIYMDLASQFEQERWETGALFSPNTESFPLADSFSHSASRRQISLEGDIWVHLPRQQNPEGFLLSRGSSMAMGAGSPSMHKDHHSWWYPPSNQVPPSQLRSESELPSYWVLLHNKQAHGYTSLIFRI